MVVIHQVIDECDCNRHAAVVGTVVGTAVGCFGYKGIVRDSSLL